MNTKITTIREQLETLRDYFATVEDRRKGALMTYGGGYRSTKDINIFDHGIETAYNIQKGYADVALQNIDLAISALDALSDQVGDGGDLGDTAT